MNGADFASAVAFMLTVIIIVAFVVGAAVASLIWWLI